jgi:predicted alpha/beta hydrolase family esterase
MKLSDADIFIIPGIEGKNGNHWHSRWLSKLPSAHLVEPGRGDTSQEMKDWTARLVAAVAAASKPAILIAHGGGITAFMRAVPELPERKIAGAFLVAAHDPDRAQVQSDAPAAYTNGVDRDVDAPEPVAPPPNPGGTSGPGATMPLIMLPFPAMLIASGNCPNCKLERAKAFADAWGATLVEAGDVGGLDAASGHGPWPEGLMRFGAFLKTLG